MKRLSAQPPTAGVRTVSGFLSKRAVRASMGVALLVISHGVMAQDADDLARQLSNPVANLVSVPIQFNYDDWESGGSRTFVNIQPVVPISVGEDWNLISRTIVPVVYQDSLFPGAGSQSGMGDMTQSLFLSPNEPSESGWIWGVGPVLLLPTASDGLLGTGKWGIGPSAVVLKQTRSGWTYGALVNHIWSFTGDRDRADVNATLLQPFASKAMGQGRTFHVNFEASHNREGGQWTVPMNVGNSKVSRIGGQLVSYYGGARYFFESPAGGADWGLRFTLTLLYPR